MTFQVIRVTLSDRIYHHKFNMAISPKYYNPSNTTQAYISSRRNHYLHKERIVVVKSYAYVLDYGEDMYSLAKKLFGEANQYMWTIIADLNELREPQDWKAGETVLLPELIVSETFEEVRKFVNEQSLTTVL